MDLNMKSDWDARARENARYYIATSVSSDEEAFSRSGRHDVDLFFDGKQDLLHGQAAVLDVGCGIGRMDEFVAPQVGKLIGIDVSGSMIEQAWQRLGHMPNVVFVEGDGWKLEPVSDTVIDLVFSHIVFQHMPRRVATSYFWEAWRILKPGGSFIFQVPEISDETPDDPPESDTFEMRFYEPDDLRAQLVYIGYEWVECRKYPVESPRARFNQLRIHVRKPD
jgi:SAM-dependent methyltransferase